MGKLSKSKSKKLKEGGEVKNELSRIENATLEDFELRATLGTGTFGRVKLVRHKPTGQWLALKMLGKVNIIKLKQVDHIKNEKQILYMLDHAFMVNMIAFFQDKRNLYMCLEYVPGGELFTLLRRENRFRNDVAVFYASQLVLAFEFMHSKNVVYRDLKPENLLIGKDGYLKICDFGFAKIVEDRAWTLCGTPEYLAPEIITQKGHSKAVDWWALGIMIYEMLAGHPPFYDDSHFGIYQKVLAGHIEFTKAFSKDARDLIRKLLQPDRSRRYGNLKNGAADIKAHPWFKLIDWNAVASKSIRAPYIPKIKTESDTSNFDKYPESDGKSAPIPSEDPFTEM